MRPSPAANAVQTLTPASEAYPALLRRIHQPPPLLYAWGEVLAEEPVVAIVGSRRASPAGRIVAERLAARLADHGVAVVSGLARGIDAAAHHGALAAGGRTIAVLGCGMDVVYPPEHARLMEAIARQGCVLTEFDRGTPPLRYHFPRRNRIIAGLVLGVVVVEGEASSGALSTARHALDSGREVMAVPGSVLNPLSRAPNGLLRDGAALVESVEDVLEALRLPGRTAETEATQEHLTGSAALAYEVMGMEAMHIDQIAQTSGLPVGHVAAILVDLQLRGLIRPLPGKQFIRVRGPAG